MVGTRRPNLVIIVMDTQRVANMGCYGYPRATTPNVDAVALEGTTCLNNISPAAWTLPSHASLWTGKYVTSHGADIRHEYLEPGLPTLPEVLNEMGYWTGAICANAWAASPAGNHRGFAWFPDGAELARLRQGFSPAVQRVLKQRDQESDAGSLFHVLLGIEQIERRRRSGDPFFLFINCTEPHTPCWPPQPYRGRFLPAPVSDREARAVVQEPWKITTGAVKLTARQWRIIKALNDGETATLDATLGLLFHHLRRTDLIDDTILIVTSDHGDELGEHPPFMTHVLTVYDTVVRVPLVIRYPTAFPPRKKLHRLTQTLDIFPTLMDILDHRDPGVLQELQGISILDHLRGRGYRTWALAEHDRPMQVFERYLTRNPRADMRWADRSLKAFYQGRFKYIWASNGQDELYDLREDPGERRNLARKEAGQAARMRRKLEDRLLSFPPRNLPDYLNESPQKQGDVRTLARLRAWGIYNDKLPPRGKPRFE